ncbi:hypothetical protein JCM10207_006866 [Rhodosporidiobolus poonsookiae]
MPMLSSQTKHFRAYGKRGTNVINRRQQLGGWSPQSRARSDSSSSSSSSGDSSDDEPVVVIKKQTKPPLVRRTVVEVVIDRPAARKTASTAAQRWPTAAAAAVDKENDSPLPVRRTTAPGKGKARALAESDDENLTSQPALPVRKAARTPLALKMRPRQSTVSATAAAMKKAAAAKSKVVDLTALETTESEDVPLRRARAQVARRAPKIISDDEAEEEEVVVEEQRAAVEDEKASEEEESDELVVVSYTPPTTKKADDDEVEIFTRTSTSDAASTTRTRRPITPVRRSTPGSHRARSSVYSSSSPLPSLSPDTSHASHTSSAFSPRPSPSSSPLPLPSSLTPLLPHLLHPHALSFSSLLSAPPAPLAYFADPAARPEWRKIGEASFSEVFETMGEEGEEVVVKVIPIAAGGGGGEGEKEMPYMSEPDAVRREIEVSELLGGETGLGLEGFVRFKGAFLVQGEYPAQLLASWDAYKATQNPPCDDQIRPDAFPSTQLYALILLENAGADLETSKLRSWKEAASVIGQVAQTVARAEERCGFEHRDLHWGNILLSPLSPSSAAPALTPQLHSRFSSLSLSRTRTPPRHRPSTFGVGLSGVTGGASLERALQPEEAGVRATLIDFTLSSVEIGAGGGKGKGKVLFDAFEDECVFKGEGDYQFDIYRSMRALVEQEGGGWEASHLKTNVLWLHYLTLKLLHSKKLKPPPSLPSNLGSSSLYASPARGAPSPLRRGRTRRSLAPSASSAVPLPMSQTARRDLDLERRAHGVLVRAEEALRGAIEGWGLQVAPAKKARTQKGAAATARRKAGRKSRAAAAVEESQDALLDFASAGAFATWWSAEVERVDEA